MKKIPCATMMLFVLFAQGQVFDNFENGNFTEDPPWIGHADKFSVENQVLRLTDNQAGTSWLVTKNTLAADCYWEFWIRLAFTPSSSNHPRIYLISDNHDLGAPLKGYYLQIGKDGTDNKRVFLYRQTGDEHRALLAGASNLAAASNNQIRIRITRDLKGNWTLGADPSGGRWFVPQGSVYDNEHTYTGWFGLLCRYTISNANRFYFDDVDVGRLMPDTIPPRITQILVNSPNSLEVFFDKAIDEESGNNPGNYLLAPGETLPLIATVQQATPHVVHLIFDALILKNTLYSLKVCGVRDLLGNTADSLVHDFLDYHPSRFDVVFNELMVNPSEVNSLPPFEYIELQNNTPFPINLENWAIQYGGTRRILPDSPLEPWGYLLLVAPDAAASFLPFANVVAVPGMSRTALSNSGSLLVLFDPDNKPVSFVHYTDRWYRNVTRSQGGWSLERIDPGDPCTGYENWMASVDPAGGTPGKPNSVLAVNPDKTPPEILGSGFEEGIRIYFSEPMSKEEMLVPESFAFYKLDRDNKHAGVAKQTLRVFVEPLPPCYSTAILIPELPMEHGQFYQLEAGASIQDCSGNRLTKNMLRVALPELPTPGDVVINEVLFNPTESGARYIELFNRSEKTIDLAFLRLANYDTLSRSMGSTSVVSAYSRLILPGEYYVATTDRRAVLRNFMTYNPHGIAEVVSLPRMYNQGGALVLLSGAMDTLDKIIYRDNMHFPLLNSRKGVALERLRAHVSGMQSHNWHSASQASGFGTPAYRNSQQYDPGQDIRGGFALSPAIFFPFSSDAFGLLTIHYEFPDPGYLASIRIFNSRGRLVRTLAQGNLLASGGYFTWDGTNDSGSLLPSGIYLIFAEVIHLSGVRIRYRMPAILGHI